MTNGLRRGSSARVSASPSASRSASTRCAPRAARSRATSRPIPDAAPVTTTIVPASSAAAERASACRARAASTRSRRPRARRATSRRRTHRASPRLPCECAASSSRIFAPAMFGELDDAEWRRSLEDQPDRALRAHAARLAGAPRAGHRRQPRLHGVEERLRAGRRLRPVLGGEGGAGAARADRGDRGGALGTRANVVNPDAIFGGSRLLSDEFAPSAPGRTASPRTSSRPSTRSAASAARSRRPRRRIDRVPRSPTAPARNRLPSPWMPASRRRSRAERTGRGRQACGASSTRSSSSWIFASRRNRDARPDARADRSSQCGSVRVMARVKRLEACWRNRQADASFASNAFDQWVQDADVAQRLVGSFRTRRSRSPSRAGRTRRGGSAAQSRGRSRLRRSRPQRR